MPTGVYDQAELYCSAFAGPVDEEVDWLLARCPATGVLEPFCGQARFAEAFAARGIDYVGLDRCAAMLERAPGGDRITLVCGDATDFSLGRRFDLAWCPINSICHLADERDTVAHLEAVRRHVVAGGAYVVEMELLRHDGPWDGGTPDRSTWSVPQPDGSVVLATVTREHCDLDARTCTERAWYRRVRDGRIVAESNELFTMRMWLWDDLQRLTAATGFEVERVFRHEGRGKRPEVKPGPQLEASGDNHYFVMRAV